MKTNREKYKNKIIKMALNGENWGVDKNTGIPKPCSEIRGRCFFGDVSPYECYKNKAKWRDEEWI